VEKIRSVVWENSFRRTDVSDRITSAKSAGENTSENLYQVVYSREFLRSILPFDRHNHGGDWDHLLFIDGGFMSRIPEDHTFYLYYGCDFIKSFKEKIDGEKFLSTLLQSHKIYPIDGIPMLKTRYRTENTRYVVTSDRHYYWDDTVEDAEDTLKNQIEMYNLEDMKDRW
jgi:hypothetical protein